MQALAGGRIHRIDIIRPYRDRAAGLGIDGTRRQGAGGSGACGSRMGSLCGGSVSRPGPEFGAVGVVCAATGTATEVSSTSRAGAEMEERDTWGSP
ncbi:hypothetical protein GCM10020258_38430 [Sphingomonas yabuuchiae]